ncbi:hypothetical protein F0244_26530, partial [Vibrio mediterranei]|nr:hypothetical protein [Vibrio mediterranei]
MIPGIGSLTNSGSMPIDMGGGHAGPSTAKSSDVLGGINNSTIKATMTDHGAIDTASKLASKALESNDAA